LDESKLNSLHQAPFLELPFLKRDIEIVERSDGSVLMRSKVPLGKVETHLPAVLHQRAAEFPDRHWLMQRPDDGGAWRGLRYGEAAQQVNAVAQWLVSLGEAGRSVMVLSGNSLEHAVMELAAMQARMPYVPVTPAYSLLSKDHAKLKDMVDLIAPSVIFVQHIGAFERAVRAVLEVLKPGTRVVYVQGLPGSLPATPWTELLATPITASLQESLQAITPETVAKYLFTSGSTGIPKAVPVTQHMLCVTMAMHAHTVGREPEVPASVLLEWLPWSHVAGGTAIFNSVLEDGGTLYIDDGRPTPADFSKTLRNLESISPTRFSSVPAGYAMLADALEQSETLGQTFFKQLRRLTSSGAKLPDSLYERIQAQAVRYLGRRVPFVAGYGSTETCAATTVVHWPTERAGLVGLPQPGVEIKLIPLDDQRFEIRARGPSVMSGYYKQPELTSKCFDEEGFYTMGDAVTFVDRNRPEEGLAFAGRVAEEFKLQSGIFVRVGSLRVEVISATAPLVTDVVVAGADRAYVGLLVWLNEAACRQRFGDMPIDALIRHKPLQSALQASLRDHNRRHTGSSMRIQRILLLREPASMDAGEITDKGYVNQRAVIARRAGDVEALYARDLAENVVEIEGNAANAANS
jgi:feruloyl-CoA synthase